ncbi:MAG: amidohydrolase family protein [Microbacterium sp.]|uniref:amidohydrolase family protein n=1 Tax=Microbacterium sp. TaxID=51671 RepID=UPI0039E64D73
MRVLDSHLHLIDPAVLSYDWLDDRLRRRFGPEELARATAAAPTAERRAFVAVQAECAPEQSLAEVDWLVSVAADAAIVGIVARAPLERGERVTEALDELRSRPLVVGVRRLLQSEPDGFSATPEFRAGAQAVAEAGLVFDACVRDRQLPHVIALADALPELRIVLDHLGKPAVGSAERPKGPDAAWLRDVRALAERPNVACKASGLPAESAGGWAPAQLRPFLDAALDAFGADRLLFGGDWPVSEPYGTWARCVAEWTAGLSAAEADAILWANAERVYRIA